MLNNQSLWTKKQWHKYEKRVLELEAEGMTTSDAQGVADVESREGKL